MFEKVLPDFFKDNSIHDFFTSSLNNIFSFKTTDHFTPDALEKFMDVTDELENSLLEFVNIMKQKEKYFHELKKEQRENNDTLRDLNDQIVVVKIEKQSFGKKLTDNEYAGVIKQEYIQK